MILTLGKHSQNKMRQNLKAIPNVVRVPFKINEPVIDFVRRVLIKVAEESGLPLLEQRLFADAMLAQYPATTDRTWTGGDVTPRDNNPKLQTSDFNFLLYRQLLNENASVRAAARRGRKIQIRELKPVEGKVFSNSSIDELTKVELTKWQQDFIYRGGQLESGMETHISRQGLVPALQVPATEPNVTWLPQIMRSNGWNEGAILLEEWLRRPAKIRPATMAATPKDFGPPVLNVVTMEWILSFDSKPAVNNTYNQLINERLWKNEAAKSAIGKMLTRTGITAQARSAPGRKIKFGDLTSSNVVEIEGVHIQSREVKIFSYYDGLTAAIANFSFHVAVRGEASYTQTGLEVTLEEIGIYAKDSYDYINDGTLYLACLCYDQPLGDWGKDVGYIYNSSFNNWRTANNKGGDFLVYSDIKVTKITPPDTFIVPSQ